MSKRVVSFIAIVALSWAVLVYAALAGPTNLVETARDAAFDKLLELSPRFDKSNLDVQVVEVNEAAIALPAGAQAVLAKSFPAPVGDWSDPVSFPDRGHVADLLRRAAVAGPERIAVLLRFPRSSLMSGMTDPLLAAIEEILAKPGAPSIVLAAQLRPWFDEQNAGMAPETPGKCYVKLAFDRDLTTVIANNTKLAAAPVGLMGSDRIRYWTPFLATCTNATGTSFELTPTIPLHLLGRSPTSVAKSVADPLCGDRPNDGACLARTAAAAGLIPAGGNALDRLRLDLRRRPARKTLPVSQLLLGDPAELNLKGTTIIIGNSGTLSAALSDGGPPDPTIGDAVSMAAQAAAGGQDLWSLGGIGSFLSRVIAVLPIAAVLVFLKGYGRVIALFIIFLAAVAGWLGGAVAIIADGAVAAAVVAVAKPIVDLSVEVVEILRKFFWPDTPGAVP